MKENENSLLIIASIAAFILLLSAILYLKHRLGNKFEVKNTDIALAFLPIVIWLLLSGKITSFQLGDLKFETAFKNAKNTSVVNQVSAIPITTISAHYKSEPEQLENVIKSKPQALRFVVGNQTYAPHVVTQYLQRLANTTVKYIVFEDSMSKFVGIISLSDLNNQIFNSENSTHFSVIDFVSWLTSGDIKKISQINGILTTSNSISKDASKQNTLDLMETNNSEILPVIENNKFLGVVERSRLTASLLLDVSKSIDN